MESILENKRIAIVAGTLGQGGAERQLLYILHSLRELGAIPSVLALSRGEFHEQRIREEGSEVYFVGQSAWRLRRVGAIVRACRRIGADVVASMHFYTNLYATTAARLTRVPEIGAMRSDCFDEIRSAGSLGPASARVPRLIAANSRQAIENAVSLGLPREKFFFLPNAIDTGWFAPGPARPEDRPLTLLFAGRLDGPKRADRFLDVLARLREGGHTVRGLLAGKGPLREELEQRAAALNLLHDATAEFLGSVDDMLPLYRRADILVSCSDAEGTPNVVLEAQATGLAIAAMAAGGMADLVHDGETGLLTPPGDDERLFEAVLRLAGDSGLRATLGRNARSFIERTHSLTSLQGHLAALYARAFAMRSS